MSAAEFKFTVPKMLSNLETALLLASNGVAVFPCDPGGKPLGKSPCRGVKWQDVPVGDPDWLASKWRRYPDAIVGMHLRDQRILVIDVDDEEGEVQWGERIAAHGGDGRGPRTVTPNGKHIFYKVPDGKMFGNGLGSFTPKPQGGRIDVRGPGSGYVIAPGSEMRDGETYQAVGGDLLSFLAAPLMPDWLVAILEAAPPQTEPAPRPVLPTKPVSGAVQDRRVTAWAEAALEQEVAAVAGCGEGGRNTALNTAAFSLGQIVAGGHLDANRVIDALIGAAITNGLYGEDRAGVDATIRSGMEAGKNKPRNAPDIADEIDYESVGLGAVSAHSGSRTRDRTGGSEPCADWHIVDPTLLFGRPIPERQWIVPGWLPCGHVTINYGDGGTGKTLISQQLMTSCATGEPWLGLAVMRCRVFALFCEDDPDELHRRQEDICKAYGCTLRDLSDMRWISSVGEECLLVTFDREAKMTLTARYYELTRAAVASGARLIVIDTAADTFGGNENDRSHVRQYIGALNKLAIAIGGAVLLNAHPSRSRMSYNGDMDGGSTAWNNTARARWSLERCKGDGADADERTLKRRKANYSSIGDTIKLQYDSGVLNRLYPPGLDVVQDRRQRCETVFLTLLNRCNEHNELMSHKIRASNFAPKKFYRRAGSEDFTVADFEQAMTIMVDDERVSIVNYGPRSDGSQKIVVAGVVEKSANIDASVVQAKSL